MKTQAPSYEYEKVWGQNCEGLKRKAKGFDDDDSGLDSEATKPDGVDEDG